MSRPVFFDGHSFDSLMDAARYRARQTGERWEDVYKLAYKRLKANPKLPAKLAFQTPKHCLALDGRRWRKTDAKDAESKVWE